MCVGHQAVDRRRGCWMVRVRRPIVAIHRLELAGDLRLRDVVLVGVVDHVDDGLDRVRSGPSSSRRPARGADWSPPPDASGWRDTAGLLQQRHVCRHCSAPPAQCRRRLLPLRHAVLPGASHGRGAMRRSHSPPPHAPPWTRAAGSNANRGGSNKAPRVRGVRGFEGRGFDGFGSPVRWVQWFETVLWFDRCRDGNPPGGPHLRTRESLNRTVEPTEPSKPSNLRTHRTFEPIGTFKPIEPSNPSNLRTHRTLEPIEPSKTFAPLRTSAQVAGEAERNELTPGWAPIYTVEPYASTQGRFLGWPTRQGSADRPVRGVLTPLPWRY